MRTGTSCAPVSNCCEEQCRSAAGEQRTGSRRHAEGGSCQSQSAFPSHSRPVLSRLVLSHHSMQAGLGPSAAQAGAWRSSASNSFAALAHVQRCQGACMLLLPDPCAAAPALPVQLPSAGACITGLALALAASPHCWAGVSIAEQPLRSSASHQVCFRLYAAC
jgi:hypothetical protein